MMALTFILSACAGDDDNGTGTGNGTGEGLPGEDFGRPVVFADLNWDSALFLNGILRYILEHGYGYETEGVPGGTIAMIGGLINGDIDIVSEVTPDTSPEYGVALEEGTVVRHGISFAGTTEGWYVPTYMIEGDAERGIEPMTPDLRHVEDLPQYWDIFQDPEVPDKGRFYGCIPGWQCQVINEIKFELYGLNDYYNRFNPGSDTALASSIVAAYESGEPWLGYYWAPTWVMGLVDLTKLDEPPYSDECWENIRDGGPPCAYPDKENDIATTPAFAETETEAVEPLKSTCRR
jgi:glycine betaine/proline transport system substrate-binding protein